MKVVFLKNITGVGMAGEVKEVKDGYAMNYLIPQGLAEGLTKHTLFVLEAQKRKKEKGKRQDTINKKHLANQLKGKIFELKVKADDKGSLYDKIDAGDLEEYLTKQGFKIDKKEINMEEKIKKIGEHDLKLNLAGEKVSIKLIISKI